MKDNNMTVRQFKALIGYTNASKAIRRYDTFMSGDIKIQYILDNRHKVFNVEISEIDKITKETNKQIENQTADLKKKQKENEKKSFHSHLVIKTERIMPVPIYDYVMLGIENMKRVVLPDDFCRMEKTKKTVRSQI